MKTFSLFRTGKHTPRKTKTPTPNVLAVNWPKYFRGAFAQAGCLYDLKATLTHTPVTMDTVSFQGIIGTLNPIKAMVRVDEDMRTISVTRLVHIDLPEGADIQLIDPEFSKK